MKIFTHTIAAGLVALLGTSAAFAQDTPSAAEQAIRAEQDTLVKIKAKKVDVAYLLPGANFANDKKVMIAPAEVAFQKNWLRDKNRENMTLSRKITDEDARKAIEAARSGFNEEWAEAFKEAGYEVVTTPGDGVLKLIPAVFDLYVNAPDIQTAGRSKSYTVETGYASLLLDVRDSVSGTLLGRFIDQRTAGENVGMQWTTSVTNRSDFKRLFKQWAKLAADGLTEMAKASPLPETLEPNKKVPKK